MIKDVVLTNVVLKHSLLRRLDSLVVCMYKILAIISEMFDVELIKQNVCLWIRMSDEGVGGEAYSHEDMRKQELLLYVWDFGGVRRDD